MLRFDATFRFPIGIGTRTGPHLRLVLTFLAWASFGSPPAGQAQTPSVTIAADPASGSEGDAISFVASVQDASLDGLVYSWDFGDGSAPITGADQAQVQHAFTSAGTFDVTVSVTGGGETQAVGRLRVGITAADPDFVGEVAGEVPRFPFRGVAGPSAALNGLSAMGLLGGDAMLGGVVDLSGPFGICLVNIGFWDDRSLAHVGLLLNLPAEAALEPRLYTGKWGDSDEGFAPGQILVSALVLWSDPTYEETKDLAMNPPESSGVAGFLDMLNQGLAGELEEEPLGPGRNWTLTSNAGAVEVTRITSEVIEGNVQAYLEGTWEETDSSGPVAYVEIEGDFSWPIQGSDRANLLACTGQG